MRFCILFVCTLSIVTVARAFNPVQNDRHYQTHLDLTKIDDGRIKVTVIVPVLTADEATYNMPKMVPGTYKVYNYGQFVHGLKAYNSKGEELVVQQLNTNQWQIANARSLYKLSYWVSSSFAQKGSKIFSPAGTAITANAFLLNNFGFLGYLQDYKNVPYTLKVAKPEGFYGSTSLPKTQATAAIDMYAAQNYFELHDCPILYARPDTANLVVAGMPIHIGVYAPEGKISAKRLKEALRPVFEAAATYLGGTLPAPRYTVLIYGLSLAQSMKGTGALEHHTSTVLTMPDIDEKMLAMFTDDDPMKMYRDIVAHEFFHIVTPLNIHSQHISDFDFMNPRMSEHLWLYEGVTEYNAMISQARAGLTTLTDFVDEVKLKLDGARAYNASLPFTQISRHALTFFEDQYLNVYQQGAIIGMATDLKLRSLSAGRYGLINLLQDLWRTYGQDTFFVDDQLFGIIAKTSGYPEMEEFFARHVAGAEPLPLQKLLAEVGISYVPEAKREVISTGGIKLLTRKNEEGMTVAAFKENNAMVRQLGLQKKDVLLAWNGKKVVGIEDKNLLEEWAEKAQPGDDIEAVVLRDVGGKPKKLKLKARAVTETVTDYDLILINETVTDKQLTLRNKWINQ